MLVRKLFISLLLIASIALLAKNKNDIFFENISVKDGLSQLSVISIFQDSKGYMWFGTRDGLNRYDGYDFEIFRHEETDSTTISDGYINCMTEDLNHDLWVGTTNGLNRYNPKTKTFKRIYIGSPTLSTNINQIDCILSTSNNKIWIGTKQGLYVIDFATKNLVTKRIISNRINSIIEHNGQLILGSVNMTIFLYDINKGVIVYKKIKDIHSPENENLKTLFKDSKGRIWIGTTNSGFGLLDLNKSQIIKHYSTSTIKGLSSNTIKSIKEDSEGNLLVGTYNGLDVFNSDDETFKVYNQEGFGNNNGGLSNYAVESLFKDNAGGIWVGTYSGGIDYYSKQNNSFKFFDSQLQKPVLGIIGPMQESKNGIWIGTEANGIMFFNPKNETFEYFPIPESQSKEAYPDNNVKSLFLKENILYVGVFKGKLFEFDVTKKKYVNKYENLDAIYSIKENLEGKLILGTYSRLGLKILNRGMISSYDLLLKNGSKFNINQVTSFAITPNDIYIGTRDHGVYCYRNKEICQYNVLSKKYYISGNKISCIFEDRQKNIWIGTADGGVNVIDPLTKNAVFFKTNNGLKDNKICSVAEDEKGRIWVVTRTGISEIDIKKGVKRTFDKTIGIKIQEFSQNSILVTSDNTIYVGGDNGFISFNPDRVESNKQIPPVIITNVTVNNVPLKKDVDKNDVLTLGHSQNNITITYSALNYTYSNRNKYAYKLEGIDKDWNNVNNNRTVNYANLSPGKYIFKVKGSNNDEVWNEEGTSMVINIKPPFWLTWWAFIIYLGLTVTIIYFIFRYYRIKDDLNYQIILKQQEDELHKSRINLFTYLSHELRTPLTLIIGPLEDIISKSTTPTLLMKPLHLMYQNAKRLLFLVNELMDFRKQEAGQFVLKAAAGNFEQFAEEIIIAFQELSFNRQIKLDYEFKTNSEQVWYDRKLFEKILLNILSNAFKHTPDKGEIKIILQSLYFSETLIDKALKANENFFADAEKYLQITIIDSGEGIPQSELSNIFNPFYQIHKNQEPPESSSGIGLALTKGLVELHHGCIWSESTESSGANFNIVIPYGNEHLNENEMLDNYKDSENLSLYIKDLPEPGEEITVLNNSTKYLILIVEDNKELRAYIKSCLNSNYRVFEASNGKEGLEIALNQMPDIIISDIMMPVMDGLQLCKKIKEDINTSHIPVILLTARVSMLQMKEGLELGADDYITKPFSSSVLLLKIKNVLQSRENLKNLYGKRFSLEAMGVEVTSADDKFIQKLYSVVEKNISIPDLTIDKFCDEMNMSSANLYRKIKAVTNLSPLEYVKSVRLQLASKMLSETDMTITEISEKVGFNSLIHFSATFRKHFGFSPSKYIKNNNKRNL